MSTTTGQSLHPRSGATRSRQAVEAAVVVLFVGENDPPEGAVRDACADAVRTSGDVRVIFVVDDRSSEAIADQDRRASQAREQLGRLIAEIRTMNPATRVSSQLHRGTLHTVLPSLGDAAVRVMTPGAAVQGPGPLVLDSAAASLPGPEPVVAADAASRRSQSDARLRTGSSRRSGI